MNEKEPPQTKSKSGWRDFRDEVFGEGLVYLFFGGIFLFAIKQPFGLAVGVLGICALIIGGAVFYFWRKRRDSEEEVT